MLLSVIITLMSCSSKKAVDEFYISNEEFYRGTNGLFLDFSQGTPPEQTLENNLLDVVLDLHNQGAYFLNGFVTLIFEKDFLCIVDASDECVDYAVVSPSNKQIQQQITNKQQQIVGLYKQLDMAYALPDNTDIGALQGQAKQLHDELLTLKRTVPVINPYKTQLISLEGKSFFMPEGEQDILRYQLKAKLLPSLKTVQDTPLVVTACYDYATTFNDEICIDTNMNALKTFTGGCKVTDLSSSGQGSPIVVERVNVHMLSESNDYVRPVFEMYVRNAGVGQVINKEKIESACSSQGLTKQDYNAVFLQSFMLSNAAYSYVFNGYDEKTGREITDTNDRDLFECSPNPLILQEGKDNYFRCSLKKGVQDETFSTRQASYDTPIQIELSYGYQIIQQKKIRIEKEKVY